VVTGAIYGGQWQWFASGIALVLCGASSAGGGLRVEAATSAT
jgi:hypothetical protein